jgi:hypothetical protein
MPTYARRFDADLPPWATALITAVAATAIVYRALRLPDPPQEKAGHSLAAVDAKSPHWAVYPPDFYPGGQYVQLPLGRMRYWLFGPEDGKRVRCAS